MARRRADEMAEIHQRWMDLMYQWEFNEKSDIDQAKELGVASQTIANWKKDASPAFWKNVADTIATQHARFAPAIYASLVREAEKGSLGHQELFFKRMQGWSPKQTNENLNRNVELEGKTDEEILMEVMRKADPALLKKVLDEKKAPNEVVGGEDAEKVG